jgi:hypothetical protein
LIPENNALNPTNSIKKKMLVIDNTIDVEKVFDKFKHIQKKNYQGRKNIGDNLIKSNYGNLRQH